MMSTSRNLTNDIEALLPFYVNGSLDPEDRAKVEAELLNNSELTGEVEALTKLRETMQQLEFGTSPGQFGLARLLRDIDRNEEKAPSKPVFSWSIAVAAVAALVTLGASWMYDRYGPSIDQASGDTQKRLTVAFQPDATQAEVSNLLIDLELEIVEGPTAIGLYKLVPEKGREQNALSELAMELRNRPDLIESVDMP